MCPVFGTVFVFFPHTPLTSEEMGGIMIPQTRTYVLFCGSNFPLPRRQTDEGGATFPQVAENLWTAAPVNGCPARSPDPAQRRSVPRLSQRHTPRFSGGKENRSKISLTPDGEGKAKIELLKLQTQIETPQKPAFRPAALLRRSWPQARNCKGAAEPKSQPSANGCDLEGRNRGCARALTFKKSRSKRSACSDLVEEGGFEPPKRNATDLQSAPFGHSGTPPYEIVELVDGFEPPTC